MIISNFNTRLSNTNPQPPKVHYYICEAIQLILREKGAKNVKGN